MTPNDPPRRPMAGIATVRLTIEGLRHTVMAALQQCEETYLASVQHHTDEAVRAFDFAGEVTRVVHSCLQEEIRRLVQNAVRNALASSGPLEQLITNAIVQGIQQGNP